MAVLVIVALLVVVNWVGFSCESRCRILLVAWLAAIVGELVSVVVTILRMRSDTDLQLLHKNHFV
jgi:hypothetical protein